MKTDHFTLLTCSLIVDNNSTRQQEGNKYSLDFFWREISPHLNGFYLQAN